MSARRRLVRRPQTVLGWVLFFAFGFVLAAAGAALAYYLVIVNYAGPSYGAARASSLSAPTAATATEASATSVTIGWTSPGTQVTGAKYEVIRNPGTSQVVVCTVSAPTCTDSGLTPGTTYDYSVTAVIGTHWHSGSATTTFTTLGVTTTSLPNGTVGSSYSTTLTAVGGTGSYTWSLASGTLPSWASLTPANGKITGTPTSAGTTTGLKFKVTDSKAFSATSGTLSLTVVTLTPIFTIQTTGGSSATITYGSQATLSETGLPPAGTGTLTFKTSATATLCTVALTVATHCKTPATLAAGTYTGIKASYSGTGGYHSANSSNTVSLTVNKATETTSTTLTLNHATRTYGSETTETFTATVTGQTGDGHPVGTVSIKTGSTTEATATFTSATGKTATYKVTLSASQLAAGSYSLKATFNPTGTNSSSNTNYTYTTSTSTPAKSFTVNKATETTSTTMAAIASPKTFGSEGQTFTGTVTGVTSDGNPTGTVTVKTSGGTTLCTTSTLTASGTHLATYSCVQTTGSLLAASGTAYVVHAQYAGGNSSTTNYTYNSSTSGTQNLTVNKAAKTSSISLTAIASPKTYGSEGQTFTGTVTGVASDGNPTGTVTVKTSGTVTLCTTSVLTASGTHAATYTCVQTTASKLAASGTAYVLHASYTGGNSSTTNYTYNGSTSATQNLTINKASTSFTIKVTGGSTKSITFGAQATLSETGLPATGTGTLTFKSASTATLCSVALTVATHCKTSATLAAGTYTIHATYAGTTNYNSSTSTNTVLLTVNKAAKTSSISLTAIASPKTYGSEGQTFTGTVTGVASDGNPTGTVTVKTSGTVTLCTTSVLTASGTHAATYTCVQTTASKLAASGTAYVLHASYTGGNSSTTNYTYNGSTSATQNLTINKASTSFTIKVTGGSTKSITFGAQATLSETGLPATGTGTLTFKSASTATLCSVALTVATHCKTSATLAAGTYTIHATYAGTTNYNSSTSTNTVLLTVNKAAKTSSISLTAIASPKTYGSEGQTFTGTVTGVASDGNPTGTVTVKTSGTVTLCTTSVLTASGTHAATYTCVQTTASKLAASGTAYVLHASYTGGNSSTTNYTYNGSTSATQNLTINKASTSFTIKVTGGSTKSITFGAQATLSETGLPATGTGTLTFKSASTATLCSVALTVATHCKTSATLAAGTYTIHATYAGTTNYNSSTSTNTVLLTVNKAAKTSSISLTAIASPKTYGSEGQTFTGTVTGVASDGNPTGTVTVKTSGTVTLCTTSVLTASGTHAATYTCVQTTASKLAASGTAYVLHASYTGGNSSTTNYTYNGSTSATQNLTINPANGLGTMTVTPTSVTVSSSHSYTFTYQAATTMTLGEVTVAVPTSWTTPQTTTSTSAGYTTESGGGGTVAYTATNHLITVTGVTLSSGGTFTVTYGGGTSATKAKAPAAAGLTTFTTQQKSVAAGTLTTLSSSPKVTVKSVITSCTAQGTVTVPANTTDSFTLIGGGGGNGAKNGSTATGGSGAGGAKYSGTLDNTNGLAVTLKVTLGCAGPSSTNANGTSHVKGQSYATSGNGGNGGGTGGGGGAGGGASAIKITSGATILVAGGGGGGGGAEGSSAGSAGSSAYSTKASNGAKTGGNGTNGSMGNNGGGGGGGGGVTTASTGGTGGAGTSGGGGGNGNSYSASSGGVTVTVSGPVSGSNAAANGSATISGGLPLFTSASTTTFVKNTSSSFTFAATGATAPTISKGYTGCTTTLPSTLTFTGGTGTATISGTPTATGTFTVCVKASNSLGTTTQAFTLTVVASPSPTFVGIGTATQWTGSTHTSKAVAFPAGIASGDLLVLVEIGNHEPGPSSTVTGWSGGDLGANTNGNFPHANVFWRVHTTSTTSVSITPHHTDVTAAAWVIAFKPNGGTPALATSVTCGPHAEGACGYAAAAATLTPTDVATTANHATEISIGMIMGANTLSLTTAHTFAFEGASKATSSGDAVGIAEQSVPTSGTTPTAPKWKQTGTAAPWAWLTFAFT